MKQVIEGCLQHFERTDDGFRARYVFPPDLAVFKGHFPNMPLVPGVFLIEAVRCAAERATGGPLRLARVVDCKFTAEVRPDDEVTIEATLADGRCNARVRTPDAEAARVKLEFESVE